VIVWFVTDPNSPIITGGLESLLGRQLWAGRGRVIALRVVADLVSLHVTTCQGCDNQMNLIYWTGVK